MQAESAGDHEGEERGMRALGCPFLSRRERRRTETRERLLEAALRLLSERDFDAVTVEMITEAADVGKGTFFNYFANKEAIVAYLFESRLRLLTEILSAEGMENSESRMATDVTDDTDKTTLTHDALFVTKRQEEGLDPCSSVSSVTSVIQTEEGASVIAEACAGRSTVGGPHWRRIVGITHLMGELDGTSKRLQRTLLSLALTNDAVRAASVGKRGSIIAVGGELVRAAQAGGELRDDLSVEALTNYLINIYFNALYAWSQSDSEESLHAVIERTYALAWEGVRPPEKEPE